MKCQSLLKNKSQSHFLEEIFRPADSKSLRLRSAALKCSSVLVPLLTLQSQLHLCQAYLCYLTLLCYCYCYCYFKHTPSSKVKFVLLHFYSSVFWVNHTRFSSKTFIELKHCNICTFLIYSDSVQKMSTALFI